ncbi:NAD-dependent protein deacetylase [Trinickia caryophylli]|uniref:protein acetyllysine N-acetyltransferase n=1 Tax=Trinickia caryophylli TaxID=28094 RepID=A0A1X7GDG1_TRICW|nr:NAD-dependent protein deacetylase [Trinickia caryophylli]PMS10792.1 NAD-dependent protein deacetylase [Trinickia caryophylli]TRX13831.1 NAD-dependent protein deacetylase [Trinickia caryophylli]WQE15422.1 NAD-dependent protein deacetylase [Trinickia caryophylli]SMF68054.1 NAD-dependent protein deacetylase, SIR2 family [Trinickia caryophylli]GLU33843.1 NAD-dependent protein deacetylase [Trinickia caryophylli]
MTETDALLSSIPSASLAAPAHDHAHAEALEALDALGEFVRRHERLFVLTGAGVSTASGIPGYRDANGEWMRAQPIQLQAFLGSEAARCRYWARSMVGWPILAAAQPNAAHRALAQLGHAGRIAALVTQNVDGLHQRAGSAGVIELHGGIDAVTCLACGARHDRSEVQLLLQRANPELAGIVAEASADGDAHLEWAALDAFSVPGCPECGGMLKPAVVFFGESVPRERVDAAVHALESADAMLVVGSSLMVYSGYRFCVWAEKAGTPIAAVNIGRTRADPLLALKVEAPCGDALATLAANVTTHFV